MDNNFNSNNGNMNNYSSNNYYNPGVGNNDWDPEATVRMTPEMANQHINNTQNSQWNQEMNNNQGYNYNQGYVNDFNMMYNQNSAYSQDSLFNQNNNDQNMIVNRIVQPIVPKKKMSKWLKITLTSIISVIVLAGIVLGILLFRAKNNMPKDEFYADNIPNELVTYELDGYLYTSQVTDIKIENKKSSLFKETAECTYTLSDEMTTRFVTCSFEIKRNLISKWKADVSYELKDVKVDFSSNFITMSLSNLGYKSSEIDNIHVDEKTGNLQFTYLINDVYTACVVNGKSDFTENYEVKQENEKIIYTTNFTVTSQNLDCEWNVAEGNYSQAGVTNPELGIEITNKNDEIIFDITTLEFGKQRIEAKPDTKYDSAEKPYWDIVYETQGKDRREQNVNLTYTINITTDGIKNVSVKDASTTYYSCSLVNGAVDIEQTQIVDANGFEFEINSNQVYVSVFDAESKAAIEFFLERYPKFAGLVNIDVVDVKSNEASDYIRGRLSGDSGSRPDMLFVNSDYLWDYDVIQNEHVLPLSDIGLSNEMYSDAYKCAVDYGTYDGKLKAMTWTLSPGYFYYKKDIAKKVLGTDDPDKIQAMISDWNKFFSVAEKMKKKGYKMIPSADIVQQPILRNRSAVWVEDGKFQADESIKSLISVQYKIQTKGYAAGYAVGDEKWKKSFSNTKIFGDFSATRLSNNFDKNIKYGMCMGPAAYCWGGSLYGCVTDACQNPGLTSLILYTICCDQTMMEKLIKSDYYKKDNKNTNYVLNNKKIMATYIESDTTINQDYFSKQNEYELLDKILNEVSEGLYKTKYDKYIMKSVVTNTKRYVKKELKNVDAVINEVEKDTKDKFGLD